MKSKTSQPLKQNKVAAAGPRWHEQRGALIAFGVVALGLAYVFASWAIDSGSLLDYAITLLLLLVGVRDLTFAVRGRKPVGKPGHDKPAGTA